MTYILEKITPADAEKILADLESDQSKKMNVLSDQWLTSKRESSMAIDRERDSYIFIAPTSRENAINPRFYFYFKKNWYELWVNDLFGNVVHFETPEPTSGPERQEFRRQLKEALLSIGRYAVGSPDLFNSIVAEFKDGE